MVGCVVLVALAGVAGSARAASFTAYVTDSADGTVTPIVTATNVRLTPIPVGSTPNGIAITPDGKTAYVTSTDNGTVTPIDIATGVPGTPILIGPRADEIAVSPDGATVYATDWTNASMTPIATATNTPGTPIPVGPQPDGIAFSADGRTAYVADDPGSVTIVSLATNTPIGTIAVPGGAGSIAITPNGQTLYVSNNFADTVTPIATATNTLGIPIPVGGSPEKIVITPDGETAYEPNYFDGTLTPIALATNTPGTPVPVGNFPGQIAITPDGTTIYVVATPPSAGIVTPLTLATRTTGPAILIGTSANQLAITPTTRRLTSTSVRCHTASVLVDQSTVCTATVTDTDSGAPVTPTGQVSFATDSVGSFGGSPCTLAGSGRTARCQVIYTPTGVGTGQHALTATFNGDSAHVGSSGHTTVAVALDATRTKIRCRPRRVVVGGSTVCTATVTDRIRGAPVPPSGLVTFASNKPGTFTGGPCTLSTSSPHLELSGQLHAGGGRGA